MVKSIRYVRKEYCFQERLVSANFKKEAIPKPARIPPQTPPAGGKTAEARRIHSPRQIVSPCLVRISIFNHLDFARKTFELCPTNTTIRYFQNFLSQTEALPRGFAARHGRVPQGGTLQNPTARQTKRKRICSKVRGSFQSFGQMP